MLPEWQRTWCLLAKNDCATISDRYFPPIGDQFVIWKANGIVLQLREDTEFLISLLTDALVQDKVEFAEAIKECGFDLQLDRKSTRLNSSHVRTSRMPSSA